MNVAVSVVSHNQIDLVQPLLEDLQRHCDGSAISVILTLNVPEAIPFDESDFSFPLRVVRNEQPQGFGANHNAAFRRISSDYFCVVNPDIRLINNPLPDLVMLCGHSGIGVAAPVVLDPEGRIEDSARRLPTPWGIARKLLRGRHKPDYEFTSSEVHPDWVAGMFMLFPSKVFEQMSGFDEGYFLYYEDVDICCRTRLHGLQVAVNLNAKVIHAARRESHGNLRYLVWHLRSMLRFFTSPVFFAALWRRRNAGAQI